MGIKLPITSKIRMDLISKTAQGILIWAAGFALIGLAVPTIYFGLLDTHEYYSIHSPVNLEDRVYSPCEKFFVKVNRRAEVETTSVSVRQLFLVKKEDNAETFRRVVATEGKGIINNAYPDQIELSFELPCDVEPGEYFFDADVQYNVRGFEKHHYWFTERFTVGSYESFPISDNIN